MEKVVVSGSRDRGISVWSIEQVDIIIIYHHLCTKIITSIFVIAIISSQVVAGGEANSKPCSRNPDMHKGWVRLKSYGWLWWSFLLRCGVFAVKAKLLYQVCLELGFSSKNFFLVEVVSQSMCYRLMGQHRQVLAGYSNWAEGVSESPKSQGVEDLWRKLSLGISIRVVE